MGANPPVMTDGGTSIRVLHVDDDASLTETAARLVARAEPRVEVRTAAAPEAALERIEEERVDCVVSEYDLPGMDGLELFEAVLAVDPDVPFILFTGTGNEAVAGEAVSAGVTDYLQKSTDTGQFRLLANRVANAVEGSRTERQLAVERRRFQVLFEQFPEPTLEYVFDDGEPHITAVNESFTDVFGYDATTAVGEPVDDLIVPEGRRAEAERIDRRVRAGDRVDEHLRRRTADGIRDFRFRNIEVPDDDAVDGYAIYADITDRVRRGRELERRNDLFRRAQELADVGAWEYDPAAEELAWTEEVYEIHGVPQSFKPTLSTALEFYHPEDREAVETALDRALADRDRFAVEARIETGDGAGRWVRTHGRPHVDDGDVVAVRGAVQDVTDRKEQLSTISDLQHSAQQLVRAGDPDRVADIAVDIATNALEHPFAGVYLLDEDGRALEPAAFTDARRDRPDRTTHFVRNDPDATVDRLFWGVFEAGQHRIVRDVGEYDPVEEAPTPARSGVLFPLGDHGVFSVGSPEPGEVSETDRYLGDILATVVTASLDRAEREGALREQKELHEARTDRLDELVSVISHDLRSPLNVADGRLELAQADCDSPHLEDAKSAIDRSRTIVEDLLTLASEGVRDPDPTPVTLRSIVNDCWVSVPSGDAALSVETDRVIVADRGRLRQLLENLFRNAVEHGLPDGDDPVTITVGDLAEGFYVADDGVGIPPDQREDVFESGYSSGDGTGLGLSIVRQVAREHDWDVAIAESAAGGARFEFTGVESPDR